MAVDFAVATPSAPAWHGLVMRAREDLSRRLSIEPEKVHLVEVTAVEWPDASLGCPEPGKVYAQVVTPGYRITLEAMGESYEYRSDAQRRVICCEPPQAQPVLDGEAIGGVELAQEDLARRLGIRADSITVVAVLRQEFPAGAFHCRTAKERVSRDESPAVVMGESILLSAMGHRYEYHASGQTVIFCRRLP